MAYPQYNPYYQQPQQMPQQMVRTSEFIPVPNEDVARNYPVAPGSSINFKNENAPYIYTKTMGISQFDQPVFKRYKLVEELPDLTIETPKQTEPINTSDYVKKHEFESFRSRLDKLEEEIQALKEGV